MSSSVLSAVRCLEIRSKKTSGGREEYIREAFVKGQTEEGRRELREERERLNAEALQKAAQREKRPRGSPGGRERRPDAS